MAKVLAELERQLSDPWNRKQFEEFYCKIQKLGCILPDSSVLIKIMEDLKKYSDKPVSLTSAECEVMDTISIGLGWLAQLAIVKERM